MIKFKTIATVLLIGTLTSAFGLSQVSETKTYKNVKGEVLNKKLSENCENALNNYIKNKDKIKLYIEANDNDMILRSAKITLRWAIESKTECSLTIPAKWEYELDGNIEKLTNTLK